MKNRRYQTVPLFCLPTLSPDSSSLFSILECVSLTRDGVSQFQNGHYVCHLKKEGEWCIFDDERVAKSEKTPFEYGYIYCFRRKE